MRILIVGAGFAGSVFANLLANSDKNFEILVIDKRDHIAGNAYTFKEQMTGVTVHKYGPHIFHTNDDDVWNYLNRFTKFNDYKHKCIVNSFNRMFSFPINLHTINHVYNMTFSPKEAEEFIRKIAKEDCKKYNIIEPNNFEEQAISMVGYSLYNIFLKYYTTKQWGRDPKELPATILKRLPVRFNYDDTYFHNAKYQGIPVDGYTKMFENMLDNKKIRIETNTNFSFYKSQKNDYIIYTGAIDEFFDYTFGRLDYRTLHWKDEVHEGDYQGNSIINYSDNDYPWTRIIEHKYFSKEKSNMTYISKEFSEEDKGDNPFYPIRDSKNIERYDKYKALSFEHKNVIFVGRLAQYQYFNMDQVVAATTKKYNDFIKGL